MIDIDRGDQENFEKKKLWPKATRNPLRIRQNRMTPDDYVPISPISHKKGRYIILCYGSIL